MKGKVKWFNDNKGFGFIELGDSREAFAHYSEIQKAGFKTLKEGSTVEFELVDSARGPQAKNIVEVGDVTKV